MGKKCICYIDVLVFSNYVKDNEHCGYALDILNNINLILGTRISDQRHMKKNGYDDQLEELITRTSVDSFEDYLALSDSVFITSDSPDIFIKQISTFLSSCFLLSAEHYRNPDNINKPECIMLNGYDIKTNKIIKKEYKWYPILFRGGLSYGEVVRSTNYILYKGQPGRTPNLVGEGVVSAVNLESSGKGPHLFIDDNIFECLSDEVRRFISEKHGKKYILWPAFHFIWENGIDIVYQDFWMELEACLNLWNAYKNMPYFEHYYELVKLMIQSFLKLCEVYFENEYNRIYAKIWHGLKEKGIEMQDDFILKLVR